VAVLAILLATVAAPSASAAHRRWAEAVANGNPAAEGETPVGCSITLAPASPSVPIGDAVTLDGALSCPEPAAAAQQTVTIDEHLLGTPGATLAGTAATDAAGDFSFTTPSGLQTAAGFWAEALGARSARTRVTVSGGVTLLGPATAGSELALSTRRSLADGTATELAFHGTVTPATPGARVVLQRQSRRNPEVWRPIAHGQVQADGSYTLMHAFAVAGPATLRVVVRGRGLRATVSETLSYEIAHTSSRSQSSPPAAISS
jgi:hypothetical protein